MVIDPSTSEPILQEVAVALYIVSSIKGDELAFENNLYQQIFEIYSEYLEQQKLPTHHDFVNHTDKNISQFVIDVLTDKYELSPNWATHKIFVTREEELLQKGVFNTVYAFKLSKLERLIVDNQEKLKASMPYEEMVTLMKEQAKWLEVKTQLAAKRGIIILR